MTARAEGKTNENKKKKIYISNISFDCWLKSEDLQND